ncbi:TetR family transcriptional regulator [Streptomyces thermolineatus]|uniref:TetR family transcriptional regulator n=1 Tax=Streptomyces thermolineatus TaxID=44033 RepID=A0ABP6A3B2_9ACTN
MDTATDARGGTGGLRERKRLRTRQAISDAAIRLFLSEGFETVSVTRVADAAEVSKPTLFKYFPTKEDLVLHRFADHEDEAARTVRDRPAGVPPLDALHRHLLDGLERRDPITGLSDRPEAVELSRLLLATPSLVARLADYTARTEALLAHALAEAVGADPGDLACRLAARQVVGAQQLLGMDNCRRVSSGMPLDAAHREAVADADRAFALLRNGLGGLLGR